MRLITKTLILQLILSVVSSTFACSMPYVLPTAKDTVNRYNDATSVISARVTKVLPGEIDANQARIEVARQKLKLARDKLISLEEQVEQLEIDVEINQSHLKDADKLSSERLKILLRLKNTNKELLGSLKFSVSYAEKDRWDKMKNLHLAAGGALGAGVIEIPINQFQEGSAPIKIEMKVLEVYKGSFKKEDLFYSESDGISINDCGGPHFSDYQHRLKTGDMLTLYYGKHSVFEWDTFESAEAQHGKMLSIKQGEYRDHGEYHDFGPPVIRQLRSVHQKAQTIDIRVGKTTVILGNQKTPIIIK